MSSHILLRRGKLQTHLWWYSRTQGAAAIRTTAVMTTVTTPHARRTFGMCWATWFWNDRTRTKMNHAMLDVAQPEWIPPICWRNAVRKIRIHKGVHCEIQFSHGD